MKRIALEHTDPSMSVHVLHLLHAVFQCMGDREVGTHGWLQRSVTVPRREALDDYRNKMQLFISRGSGEPTPPQTIRQVFKQDQAVQLEVTDLLQQRGENVRSKKLRNETVSKLFDEACNKPAGLDRFTHLVEKDHERFARELKVFKEKVRQLDEEHGLLPVSSE